MSKTTPVILRLIIIVKCNVNAASVSRHVILMNV